MRESTILPLATSEYTASHPNDLSSADQAGVAASHAIEEDDERKPNA